MSTILTSQAWATVLGVTTEPTEIGRVLRRIRAYRRMSQSALARRAAINHAHISRIESGSRNATREMVEVLAEALEATDQERGELMIAAGFVPDDSLDLLRAWSRVPEDLRDRIMAVIEAVGEGEEAA